MKKILIYILLAAMVFSFASCKENNSSVEEGKVYTFVSGNTQIAIDADAAPILAALGEWIDYDESASCAFEGLDKVYIYAGFEIQTYPMGEKDFVYMVELYDDTVATEKGIRIGSTKEAVVTAYGTPDKESDTALTYNGNGMSLQFLLSNNIVTSIQYSKVQ